jgi:SAM-dependent methyltransferase
MQSSAAFETQQTSRSKHMTAQDALHPSSPPSPWVQRWSHLLPAGATVLDVACGQGRHVHWFVQRGCKVTGVDRQPEALAKLPAQAIAIEADIESGSWPLAGQSFDLVLVTNYLWRPLMATLVSSVRPGGLLIYETFALGNETVGRPANPDFLLKPGELLELTRPMQAVAFEQGFLTSPDRFVQRIVAVHSGPPGAAPPRFKLPS